MNRIRHLPIIDWLRSTPFWTPARTLAKAAIGLLGRLSGQTVEKVEADAQRYWTQDALQAPNMYHWRGEGGLGDEEFFAMGEANARRFHQFAKALDFPTADLRVLEWGCGGGTNLRALVPNARELVGVEISPESLEQTALELAEAAPDVSFVPILVDVATPETALDALPGPVDLVVCLNVLELVPSPEYGDRLLRIARKALRPGGMALVQIRYQTGLGTKPARAFYGLNVTSMTSYRLDDFWQRCADAGLTPHLISLSPSEEIIGTRYAYYALTATQA